tara:strand:+ start:706 stop:879 length:174 start_codon:yes stop_codon:yes gene_type:complete
MQEESLFKVALLWLLIGGLFYIGIMIKLFNLGEPPDMNRFEMGLYGLERVAPVDTGE